MNEVTDGRCPWAGGPGPMRDYHDHEWGVPSRDDRHLFEMLILEGAQAGLSWSTVLAKRGNYRRVYRDFDPAVVAEFDDAVLEAQLADPGIIRNRLKVKAAVTNARSFLALREAHGSFANYLWGFVEDKRVVNHPLDSVDLPVRTELSDRLSKDLKRRGFTFVGSTIVYSFLQAVGVVDDHLEGCPAKRG
jgi:DNA-3-methyladenine glycosylase I